MVHVVLVSEVVAVLLTLVASHHTAVAVRSQIVTVDCVAFSSEAVKVGSSIEFVALAFGIRVEEVAPLAALVSAIGAVIEF